MLGKEGPPWKDLDVGEEYCLLASKAQGLFSSEHVFYVTDAFGNGKSFFADVEAWDVPFGVRVKLLQIDYAKGLVLVGLPNGEGGWIVRPAQLRKL